jgi:hypothetical protein
MRGQTPTRDYVSIMADNIAPHPAASPTSEDIAPRPGPVTDAETAFATAQAASTHAGAARFTTERPPFLPLRGELVQYKIAAQHLRSVKDGKKFVSVDGDIWLTSHRIWFEPRELGGDALRMAMKSFGADQAFALPLRQILKVGERSVESKPALRLHFANGGREYFRVNHIDRWIKTIRAMQPNAPDLDFTRIPPVKNGVDHFQFPWGLLKLAVITAVAGAAAYYYGRGRWF